MGGRVKFNQLSDLEKKKYLGDFYEIISKLRGYEEVREFFRDLLSLSEIVMLSKRVQIAKMILRGYDYDYIKNQLKVGESNIARVERWFNYGGGGYRKKLLAINPKSHKKFIENLSYYNPNRSFMGRKSNILKLLK